MRSPVFVIEGKSDGNLEALQRMARASKNPNLHFLPVEGANHFSVLFQANYLIATKIGLDTEGPDVANHFTIIEDELNQFFRK